MSEFGRPAESWEADGLDFFPHADLNRLQARVQD